MVSLAALEHIVTEKISADIMREPKFLLANVNYDAEFLKSK